jgi:hypothetical protein
MIRKTTNPHFQLYEHQETQRLVDELVAESIEIAGWDCYYMPRRRVDFDDIYYEDAQSKFDTAYQIPLYIKSWQGFEGNDALMTQFGIEVQLQLILTMSRIHWEQNIEQIESANEIWRPREGDLIYIPNMDYRVYEIKYVEHHPYGYQHGYENQFDLTVELFRYAGEILDTGIEQVDCLQKRSSINAYDWSILTEAGLAMLTEEDSIITIESFQEGQEEYGIIDENDEIIEASGSETSNTADDVITWDSSNPFSEDPW